MNEEKEKVLVEVFKLTCTCKNIDLYKIYSTLMLELHMSKEQIDEMPFYRVQELYDTLIEHENRENKLS